MLQQASCTLHRFELADDAQVHLLGDEVAIVGYKSREELTVEERT